MYGWKLNTWIYFCVFFMCMFEIWWYRGCSNIKWKINEGSLFYACACAIESCTETVQVLSCEQEQAYPNKHVSVSLQSAYLHLLCLHVESPVISMDMSNSQHETFPLFASRCWYAGEVRQLLIPKYQTYALAFEMRRKKNNSVDCMPKLSTTTRRNDSPLSNSWITLAEPVQTRQVQMWKWSLSQQLTQSDPQSHILYRSSSVMNFMLWKMQMLQIFSIKLMVKVFWPERLTCHVW